MAISSSGSARNAHVLRVRSAFCALAVNELAATLTPPLD
ncbi:L-asparaginase [Enterobacter sp. EA-1]|nr:L-asparaginase [Enterobacter sp. EA-1]